MQQPQSSTLKQQTETLVRSYLQLGLPYAECVRTFKKEFIVLVLLALRGNQCRAAHALGMHRNTLTRTLRELKIDARLIRILFAKHPALQFASGSRTGLRPESRVDARNIRRNSTPPATASEAKIERRKLVLVTTAAQGNPASTETTANQNPASSTASAQRISAQNIIEQNIVEQGNVEQNNPVGV